MKAPPQSIKNSLTSRLNDHARARWPELAGVDLPQRSHRVAPESTDKLDKAESSVKRSSVWIWPMLPGWLVTDSPARIGAHDPPDVLIGTRAERQLVSLGRCVPGRQSARPKGFSVRLVGTESHLLDHLAERYGEGWSSGSSTAEERVVSRGLAV